eukprot:gene15294-biopygen11218
MVFAPFPAPFPHGLPQFHIFWYCRQQNPPPPPPSPPRPSATARHCPPPLNPEHFILPPKVGVTIQSGAFGADLHCASCLRWRFTFVSAPARRYAGA